MLYDYHHCISLVRLTQAHNTSRLELDYLNFGWSDRVIDTSCNKNSTRSDQDMDPGLREHCPVGDWDVAKSHHNRQHGHDFF